ncbi:hypothetical protein NDU88_005243 [Pleurodeles waltl]|uniref:Secreted protein n=1 Tax=Pleurodeles waltl TaxID=8319 RepID=A0AAV7VL72_PLEWA|nr:hypothetical protein NDU88_005243 [Pleurodeles waltl]
MPPVLPLSATLEVRVLTLLISRAALSQLPPLSLAVSAASEAGVPTRVRTRTRRRVCGGMCRKQGEVRMRERGAPVGRPLLYLIVAWAKQRRD